MKHTEESMSQEDFNRNLFIGCVELFLGTALLTLFFDLLPHVLR